MEYDLIEARALTQVEAVHARIRRLLGDACDVSIDMTRDREGKAITFDEVELAERYARVDAVYARIHRLLGIAPAGSNEPPSLPSDNTQFA